MIKPRAVSVTSAANLKFLSVLRQVGYRNFKLKMAALESISS
jgi:hypothetical protein